MLLLNLFSDWPPGPVRSWNLEAMIISMVWRDSEVVLKRSLRISRMIALTGFDSRSHFENHPVQTHHWPSKEANGFHQNINSLNSIQIPLLGPLTVLGWQCYPDCHPSHCHDTFILLITMTLSSHSRMNFKFSIVQVIWWTGIAIWACDPKYEPIVRSVDRMIRTGF